jgi:hypothetical protein
MPVSRINVKFRHLSPFLNSRLHAENGDVTAWRSCVEHCMFHVSANIIQAGRKRNELRGAGQPLFQSMQGFLYAAAAIVMIAVMRIGMPPVRRMV